MQRLKIIRLLAIAAPVCALLWGLPCTPFAAPQDAQSAASQGSSALPEPPALGETTPSGAPKARVVPAPDAGSAPAAGSREAASASQGSSALPEPPALGETTPSGAPKARVVPAPDAAGSPQEPAKAEAPAPASSQAAPAPASSQAAPAPASGQAAPAEPSKVPAPAASAASTPEHDKVPNDAGRPAGVRIRAFQPPVAMVKQLERDTDLPALQLSLSLVSFIGDTEGRKESHEDAYAILPLAHDSLLEVYDLHYDGGELIPSARPSVRRLMASNEAYVLRVPTYAGVPSQAVCVTTRGEKHCWNPGHDELEGDFIRWSTTKGLK